MALFRRNPGMSAAFFWNCDANSRIKHSSMSRPPTRSEVSLSTRSLPRTNWTILTEKMECPMEQNLAVSGTGELRSHVKYADRLGKLSYHFLWAASPREFKGYDWATWIILDP